MIKIILNKKSVWKKYYDLKKKLENTNNKVEKKALKNLIEELEWVLMPKKRKITYEIYYER